MLPVPSETKLAKALFWTLFFACTAYVLSLGALGFVVGPYDYNHLSSYYELARRHWLSDSFWPHFNPYLCGGRTLGGDPQVPIFHPVTLFSFIVGPVFALRLEMLALLALGAWGMWAWLRHWNVSTEGRLWGTFLFLSGGFTVARVLVGHVTLGFYFLLPLYFYLSYRICESKERDWNAICGLFWLTLYSGWYKPNYFLHAVPLLAIEAVARSALSRSPKPFLLFSAATLVAGLGGAVGLWPASVYFAQFPRVAEGIGTVPLYTLLASLLLPLKALPESWYGPLFLQRHEYSVFVGPVALWFALRARKLGAEQKALLIFAVFSAWMGLGSAGTLEPTRPFSWFAAVWPGFASIRVPVRFWNGVFLAAVAFSAVGFRWPQKRGGLALVVFLGVLPLSAQLLINLTKINSMATGLQWNPPSAYPAEIWRVHAPTDESYAPLRLGQAVLECVENVPALGASGVTEGPILQYEASPPQQWLLRRFGWSEIDVKRLHPEGTAQLSLNLNHHPYWRATQGRIVSAPGERLKLELPPGVAEATLLYEQPRVRAAAALTLLTLLGLSIGTGLSWRRRKMFWKIGLTGGMGSGKSEAGRWFAAQGWMVVELDAVAREFTTRDPAISAELAAHFGKSVFNHQGHLDRSALRKLVFDNPEARKKLEAILHPRLKEFFIEKTREARRSGAPGIVCEGATIIEKNWYSHFDAVLLLTASESLRIERAKARTGLDETTLLAILATQASDTAKRAAADWVIENEGSVQSLHARLAELPPFRLKSGG